MYHYGGLSRSQWYKTNFGGAALPFVAIKIIDMILALFIGWFKNDKRYNKIYLQKNWASNFNDVKNIFQENLQSSVRVVILMIIAAGIAYPLLLALVGSIKLPFQPTGSILTLDGQVVGSKLIAQEFKSEKLFHIRPAANSTSRVDPDITPRMLIHKFRV
jgi:hypothetical protein